MWVQNIQIQNHAGHVGLATVVHCPGGWTMDIRVGQKTRCVNNQNTCMLWPFPSINAAISQNFKALGPCLRGSPEMSLLRIFLEMPAYLAFINEFVLIFISEDYISENIYPILVTGHLT